jgi:hypothetical protein
MVNSLSSFSISHNGLTLEIRCLDLEDVHIHEEIIPDILNRLADSIVNDKILRHPVIVDASSHVVLDGMHRVAAMKMIGCKRIVCCLVEYMDKRIIIGRWYRAVIGAAADKARFLLDETMIPYAECSRSCQELVDAGKAEAAVETPNAHIFVPSSGRGLIEAYRTVKRIEEIFKSHGCAIDYYTEADAMAQLKEGKVDAVLMTPLTDKATVVAEALRGNVFVHKATRHIIPARPLNVNIPLELLKSSELSLDAVNSTVSEILRGRVLTSFPANSLIDGRRYEEETFVFS